MRYSSIVITIIVDTASQIFTSFFDNTITLHLEPSPVCYLSGKKIKEKTSVRKNRRHTCIYVSVLCCDARVYAHGCPPHVGFLKFRSPTASGDLKKKKSHFHRSCDGIDLYVFYCLNFSFQISARLVSLACHAN